MGPFELAALAIIAGCLLSAYKAYKKGGRSLDREAQARIEAAIQRIEERVSTLESIVTDKSYHLKQEIERL